MYKWYTIIINGMQTKKSEKTSPVVITLKIKYRYLES